MTITGKAKTLPNLRDLAVLVTLSLGSYTPRQLDKGETKRINEQHGAKGTPLKVHRDRLSGTTCGEILTKINKAQSECRALYYSRTLPWDDSGRRMADNKTAFKLVSELRRREDIINGLAEQFAAAWPNALEEAKKALNGGWKEDYAADYQIPADEIRQRFKFNTELESMPRAADLRMDCPDAVMQQLIAQAEQNIAERFEQGCRDAYKRLYSVLEGIHERASIPHGKDGTRDTIEAHIKNLAELIDVLPSLNIAKDANLDRLTSEAKKRLLTFDMPAMFENEQPSVTAIANRMKDDKQHRAEAAKAAGEILNDIRQYLGG